MHHTRLRAPSKDRAVLQEPPLAEASELLNANTERLSAWSLDLQGRNAGVLRAHARDEAVKQAQLYHERSGLDAVPDDLDLSRIVATGHQPELFHPGVWVKNFALAGIARQTGSVALNLIVDNDIPKGPFIRVPTRRGEQLVREVVPFDNWAVEAPYESQGIVDWDRFSSFGSRVVESLDGLISDPLIESFWPHAVEIPVDVPFQPNVGLRFARARRLIEGSWGIHNLEVPLSKICESDAFLWFTSHMMANLDRFRETHNQALFAYRKLYGIRSKNHPVAALRVEADGWQEAPFWIWRDAEPRRHSLWIRARGRNMELRIGGEGAPFMEIPLAADREGCCAVEQLHELPKLGIRLRTRALTTTMFARLFLSDLFIHGIGGAKYDELGDEIVRGFYQIEPPRFMTMTLTLHAGLSTSGTGVDDLRVVNRQLRQLEFNPQCLLSDSTDATVRSLIEAREAAVALRQETRRERVQRYNEIRRINQALQPYLADQRQTLMEERFRVQTELKREAVARSREYAIVVHSTARLKSVLTDISSGGNPSAKNWGISD